MAKDIHILSTRFGGSAPPSPQRSLASGGELDCQRGVRSGTLVVSDPSLAANQAFLFHPMGIEDAFPLLDAQTVFRLCMI